MDVVPSSTIAISGCTRDAATCAPRRPTSSCTVNTAVKSQSKLSSSALISARQPTRSSNAREHTQPSPNSSGSESNVT